MLLIDSIRGRERNLLACNYELRFSGRERRPRPPAAIYARRGTVTFDQSNIHLMTLATGGRTNQCEKPSRRARRASLGASLAWSRVPSLLMGHSNMTPTKGGEGSKPNNSSYVTGVLYPLLFGKERPSLKSVL